MVFHSWGPPPSLPAPFCQVLSSMNIPLTIPLPTPALRCLCLTEQAPVSG